LGLWQEGKSFEYALAQGGFKDKSYIKVMDWVADLTFPVKCGLQAASLGKGHATSTNRAKGLGYREEFYDDVQPVFRTSFEKIKIDSKMATE
jgi:hypothetical protein